MTADNREEVRTVYGQWIPQTLITGAFALFGIFLFAVHFCKWNSLKPGFLLLPGIGAVLWTALSQRVRFEADRATLFTCTFFPLRVRYEDVASFVWFSSDPDHPQTPTSIVFLMKSGQKKHWQIFSFTVESREKIRQELESRIRILPPDRPPEMPDIQKWADWTGKKPMMEKLFFGTGAFVFFLFGFMAMCHQLEWDRRIRNWDKADGIILKNTTRIIKSSRSNHSREVADVLYRYPYRGKTYTGTRIVYDSTRFPALKTGSRRQVIVNPADPRDCAIMFWYHGHWGLIRWIECVFYYLVSLLAGIPFFLALRPGRLVIPDRLKTYLAEFPPERIAAALQLERAYRIPNDCPLTAGTADFPDELHAVFGGKPSRLGPGLLILLMLGSVVLTLLGFPLALLAFVLAGLSGYSLYWIPGRTVLDFEEGELIFERRTTFPWEWSAVKKVPFGQADHLLLSNGPHWIILCAVGRSGEMMPLCKVRKKHLPTLCGQLPLLAEKLGHLPITFF